ncbi:MAG: RagB/SusD family nutrient uptake outer membrane protein [Bacteroidota bacterium]
MKNSIYIFLLVISTLIFQSCTKFLELEPVSITTTENSYDSAEDFEAALIAVYSLLHSEYFIWDNILLSDVRSDNCYAGPPDDVDIFAYDQLTIEANNSRVFLNWSDFYKGISRANLIIQKIGRVNGFDGDRKNEIIGEAKFLRALFYFQLTKLYGGVPIVKDMGSIELNEIQVPRNTEREVYDFIVKDLENASVLLPVTFQPIDGRATKGAADALLAKAWAQRSNRDYLKVIEYCDKVIESTAGYSLLSDYRSLFDGENYNNSESIFEIQYLVGNSTQGNWGPQLFLPPSITGDHWRKYATPSVNLVNAFIEKQDTIRFEASIIWEKVSWIDEYWSPSYKLSEVPFVYKQKHADGWHSGDQFYLLRLADILLLKAEAMAYMGEGDMGRSILNKIRNRAGLTDTNVLDDDLLKAIIEERRLELAFEGHRWDDMVRNGIVVSTMNHVQELNRINSEYVEYNMEHNKILLPIPLQEIERNQKLEQNPGY